MIFYLICIYVHFFILKHLVGENLVLFCVGFFFCVCVVCFYVYLFSNVASTANILLGPK